MEQSNFIGAAKSGGFIGCGEEKCSVSIQLTPKVLDTVFYKQTLQCTCGNVVDVEKVVRTSLLGMGALFGSAMVAAGARAASGEYSVQSGKFNLIDLTHLGLSEESDIHYLELFGRGAFVRQVASNIHFAGKPKKRYQHRVIAHAEVPDDPDLPPQPNPTTGVSVVWSDGNMDVSLRQLVEAGRFYTDRMYEQCVIPANVAVESALSAVINDWLCHFASAESIKGFMVSNADYSSQLKVLVHVSAHYLGAPKMPSTITNALKKLAKHRNDLAHTGRCDPVNQDVAANFLVSAIFGLRYATLLRSKLDATVALGALPKRNEPVDTKKLKR